MIMGKWIKNKVFYADMETATEKTLIDGKESYVYAIGCIEKNDTVVKIFDDSTDVIFDMFKYVLDRTPNKRTSTIYFHHLKYDGMYILSYLIKANFKFNDTKSLNGGEFNAIIAKGQHYFYEICFGNKKIKIIDSRKLVSSSIENMAKDFNLDINKLGETYDYDKLRLPPYKLDEDERKYLENDVLIMQKVFNSLTDESLEYPLKGLTAAASALNTYKKMLEDKYSTEYHKANNLKIFDMLFPQQYIREEYKPIIRNSYYGGLCTVKRGIEGMDILERGVTLDTNSMYPYIMKNFPLPCGIPTYHNKFVKVDNISEIAFYEVAIMFKIKEGKLSTIKYTRDMLVEGIAHQDGRYLYDTNGMYIKMFINSIDLETLKTQCEYLEISKKQKVKSVVFKTAKIGYMFGFYVDYWVNVKIRAKREGNQGMYQLAKIMLNSLYGKFGKSYISERSIPKLNEEGILDFSEKVEESNDEIYPALASSITSWGRSILINTIDKVGDDFLYCDTDSIHIKCDKNDIGKYGIRIDDNELGAWKIENEFIKARYLNPKQYIEVKPDNEVIVKCGGLPEKAVKSMTWENFKQGTKVKCLQPRLVGNGVILVETIYEFK